MRLLRRVLILIFCFIILSCCSNQASNSLYKLLIYYGTPEGVNNLWDIDEAVQIFASYDYIVFGEGHEDPDNENYVSTKEIISKIHSSHQETKIFGYVDLDRKEKKNSYSDLKKTFHKWRDIGVDGIFLDDAGFDYEVSRSLFNVCVQTIHDMGMPTFVNAWDPDDVMSDKIDPIYNPNGDASEMGIEDYYLLEEFLYPSDISDPNSPSIFSDGFKEKMDKVIQYRKELGVKVLSISRLDYAQYSSQALDEFFKMNEATAGVFSLDGYGVAPIEYSSSSVDEDIVRDFPYISNYKKYYTTDVKYTSNEEDNDFIRGRFRIHSQLGEHFYKIP